jgi:hypothetical protein
MGTQFTNNYYDSNDIDLVMDLTNRSDDREISINNIGNIHPM